MTLSLEVRAFLDRDEVDVTWRLPQQYTAPREHWGRGAWEDEPDLVEWAGQGDNRCIIRRNSMFGVFCGYLGVPPGHRWHGVPYEQLEHVQVHGQLTFSAPRSPSPYARQNDPQDLWWLGFDCGHGLDYSPALMVAYRDLRGYDGLPGPLRPRYRDLAFVLGDVFDLEAQALAAVCAAADADSD